MTATPNVCTCTTCGWRWNEGTNGEHSCTEWMAKRIAQLDKSWLLEYRIIELLVVGGFVKQEKVDQARSLLEGA